MNRDLSWLLNDLLEVDGARHAVLVSADGLVMTRSSGVDRDLGDEIAAATSGLQSLSRAMNHKFIGGDAGWSQTLMEYRGGWVILSAAGQRAYLVVSAAGDANLEVIAVRIQQAVKALGENLSAAARSDVRADA